MTICDEPYCPRGRMGRERVADCGECAGGARVERVMEALKSANEICRSAYNIAHRITTDHGPEVLETNFEAFKWRCKESLTLQHRVMYPEQYTDERRVQAHDGPLSIEETVRVLGAEGAYRLPTPPVSVAHARAMIDAGAPPVVPRPGIEFAACTLCSSEESPGFYTGCMIRDGASDNPEGWTCNGMGILARMTGSAPKMACPQNGESNAPPVVGVNGDRTHGREREDPVGEGMLADLEEGSTDPTWPAKIRALVYPAASEPRGSRPARSCPICGASGDKVGEVGAACWTPGCDGTIEAPHRHSFEQELHGTRLVCRCGAEPGVAQASP